MTDNVVDYMIAQLHKLPPHCRQSLAAACGGYQSQTLDLVELLRAVRVISEAANLEQLLQRIMHLLLEDAGTSRGCLFLTQDGNLHLSAYAQVSQTQVETFTDSSFSLTDAIEKKQLPERLIRKVSEQKQFMLVNQQELLSQYYGPDQQPANGARSAICLPICKQNELYGLVYLENADLEDAFTADRIQILNALAGQIAVSIENALLYDNLENRVQQRTRELEHANQMLRDINHQLNTQIDEREKAQRERDAMKAQLLDTAHHAGMAEIATGVLHNIGNAVNCVNVRLNACRDGMRNLEKIRIRELVELIQQHQDDLGTFFSKDRQGTLVPDYMAELAKVLESHKDTQGEHLDHLQKMVTHVNKIVAWQNNFTGVSGIQKDVAPGQLIEDTLTIIHESLNRPDITIDTEIEPNLPPLSVGLHKAIQILINLIKNAAEAIQQQAPAEGKIGIRVNRREDDTIAVSVHDNGIGISAEQLKQIFQFGFTTKKDSHGFGLHTSILSAQELGGTLTAQSNGSGQGACFTLTLPCVQPARV